jgi:two-component system LytT family response regulator
MNTVQASLDPKVFIRVHRSAIVNIERIKELQPASHGEYVIVLRNGVRLQSTRSYHEKVKALTSNPF